MASHRTFVMPGRKHRGKTLDAIMAAGDRPYIEWAATDYPDPKVRAAATSFLESTASERSTPLLAMPRSIAADTSLSPGAKLVFAAIWTAADLDPDQRCTLSNDELQAQTALSSKQVKRLLVELEGLGLIARVVSAARRSHILITWTTAWPATTSEGTPCPLSAGTPCPPWEGPDEIGPALEHPGKALRITAKRTYHRPLS
jgi:DNA-binding MarR family transcriptional regulator